MKSNRQWMQETSRSLERGLLLVAGRTGVDKASGVLSQGGPPEAELDDILGSLDSRVAGELGAVGPLQNLRPEVRWHEQAIGRTRAGKRLVLDCGSNSPPNFQVSVTTRRESGSPLPPPGTAGTGRRCLTLQDPGRYERVKSNRVRKSDQRACRESIRRTGYIQDSYDQSIPETVATSAHTSVATPPRLA